MNKQNYFTYSVFFGSDKQKNHSLNKKTNVPLKLMTTTKLRALLQQGEGTQVRTENWNISHGNGAIDPANFSPYPKNSIIAKFFKEIGWVDELGSGVRNTHKFLELYTPGATPTFTEGDVFEMIIPMEVETLEGTLHNISAKTKEETSEKGSEKSSEKIMRLLKEDKNRSAKDLSALIGISDRAIEKQLAKLQEQSKLQRIGPDKGGYWQVIK